MSKSPPYARIAITILQKDLEAAERLAKAQDRSRSWIVAEAVRRYVAAAERAEGEAEVHALNRPTLPSRPGLGASRTPRGFDSYEEFLDWKRDRDVAP